jgi:hypothetical protein
MNSTYCRERRPLPVQLYVREFRPEASESMLAHSSHLPRAARRAPLEGHTPDQLHGSPHSSHDPQSFRRVLLGVDLRD